jgi:hypothetical protein
VRRPLEALAGLLLAAAVGGLAFGLVYGGHDGLLMGLFLLAVGLPVLAAVELLVRGRRAAGSLARQLTAGVSVAVALVTLGCSCSSPVMTP